MGQNSTEVAYQFGQFGSALTQLDGNTITAPDGYVIVAIQFLAGCKLDSLIAEDANMFFNTASSAHSGKYTRIVNQGNSTTNKIIFDNGSGTPISNADAGCKVGDVVYDSNGVRHGKVVALDPDGDNTAEIQIDASVAIVNNEVLHFSPETLPVGGGGQTLTSGDIFPAGLTICGRWTSMSINDDDADGGAICYFGK